MIIELKKIIIILIGMYYENDILYWFIYIVFGLGYGVVGVC